MVVHPAHGNFNGTLLNALLFKFLSDPNKDIKPYLVRRLIKIFRITPEFAKMKSLSQF